MIALAKKLWPINRSITGKGVRQTLKILKKENSILKIKSIKSGTKVFDWKVPAEWEIRDAWIKYNGKKILNFKDNNLHVVGYSHPVKTKLNYKSLIKKLHFLKKQKNAIPYVTSYYKKNWGFCCTERFKNSLNKTGKYEVFIDSKFNPKGKMNYGEIFIKGKSSKEIMFTSNICHPSMANNEISGICLISELAKFLKNRKNFYSYRFLFIPETIGSISIISKKFDKLKKNLIAGFVVVCVGDKGNFSYIQSRYGNNLADKTIKNFFKKSHLKLKKYTWLERGSDERQFCSPLVNLPFASLTRTKYGKFKEYHTSLDKLDTVVTNKNLNLSLNIYKKIINNLESNFFPKCNFYCEPMLGKRGLYNSLSIKTDYQDFGLKLSDHILNFISYSDGSNNLHDISKLINLSLKRTEFIYKLLVKKNLVY